MVESRDYYSDFVILYCMRCNCVIQLGLAYPRNIDQNTSSQVNLLTDESLPYTTYLAAHKLEDKWCECKDNLAVSYKFFIADSWMPKCTMFKEALPRRIMDLIYVKKRWI